MIIAIDGTAASGKGTLGRTLAMQLQFDYLDTGQLYRAVGYFALSQGLDLAESDPKEIVKIATNLDLSQPFGKELRTSEVGIAASKVATFSEVRHALLRKQRNFAEYPPNQNGAILDGRDIGTVVLPEADAKFYVDAAAGIRAKRRHMELSASGEKMEFSEVLSDLIQRDCRDKNRTVAPLNAADDAFLIDSSDKNAEEVLELALSHLRDDKLI